LRGGLKKEKGLVKIPLSFGRGEKLDITNSAKKTI